MSLRVVLYAEGGRETRGLDPIQLAPGDLIPEDALGPAHHLIRRSLHRALRIPEAAVRFEEGLRLRGRVPRGSELWRDH